MLNVTLSFVACYMKFNFPNAYAADWKIERHPFIDQHL